MTNATLPYLLKIANAGLEQASQDSQAIYQGVNTHAGHITYPAVAESQEREWRLLREIL